MSAEHELIFNRTPEYVQTTIARETIADRIAVLTDAQVVQLANVMVSEISDASPEARQVAEVYAPTSGKKFTANQKARARQFVTFWVQYETMTSSRAAAWRNAIDNVVKK